MTIEVLRRTFAAARLAPGSSERARLNRDTLTSEYFASHRYMTCQPFTMDDGTPHPTQRYLCRTFKTKGEADTYATREQAMTELLTSYTIKDLESAEPQEETKPATPTGQRVNVDQADLFNDQGSLFSHVVQPGELE